jgi:ribosome maturation factor RimP
MVGQALQHAIERCVSERHAQLIDLVIRGEKGGRVVEVFVDAKESVTSALCTKLAREIGDVLDTQHLIDGPYRLTVSSPGLDRPLTYLWQYQKHVGRPLQLRRRLGEQVQMLTGTLSGVSGDSIILQVSGELEPLRVVFDTILEAKIMTPW